MTTSISGTTGIVTPALDLTTPLPVSEGGTGTSTVKPYRMVLGTSIATTSGTSHDFTSIPNWVKRITVMFNGVSTSGTSVSIIQIGSGSIKNTGYLGCASASAAQNQMTVGFSIVPDSASTHIWHGSIVLSLLNASTNLWVESGVVGRSDALASSFSGGSNTLSGTLDRIRLTTVNGTDTFDAGSVNIMYEGYED